jgi:methionyl-tRNA formyltransferase
MQMKEELDSGPICNQYPISILDNENSEDLASRLSALASEKILENIDDIIEGKAVFKEQDHNKATYAKKIDKAEGKIFWNESAKKIIGKINGLYPFPGAFFLFKGERYKILKAELSNTTGDPGVILNENFEIGCAENSIKVLEIQRQGKKVQKIAEFMLGTQMKKGIILKDA